MSALQEHIKQLVAGIEPDDDFPKNESSWEELYEFGQARISDIVTLTKERDALKAALEAAEIAMEYITWYSDGFDSAVVMRCRFCDADKESGTHFDGCKRGAYDNAIAKLEATK